MNLNLVDFPMHRPWLLQSRAGHHAIMRGPAGVPIYPIGLHHSPSRAASERAYPENEAPMKGYNQIGGRIPALPSGTEITLTACS
jgi:hypothetical protein